MGFGDAIKSGFNNYVGFSGRAARSEYWYWTLFVTLVSIALSVLDVVLGTGIISPLWSLAVLLPGLAVSFRRLHDIDRSAWWLLIILVPIVGLIVLLVFACQKGTDGDNRFGADPLA